MPVSVAEMYNLLLCHILFFVSLSVCLVKAAQVESSTTIHLHSPLPQEKARRLTMLPCRQDNAAGLGIYSQEPARRGVCAVQVAVLKIRFPAGFAELVAFPSKIPPSLLKPNGVSSR
jgi:hypothetical protein